MNNNILNTTPQPTNEKCFKCGRQLLTVVLTSYPPQYRNEPCNCGVPVNNPLSI